MRRQKRLQDDNSKLTEVISFSFSVIISSGFSGVEF